MTDKGLTPKQELFAMKYIETGNAAEAYRLAYDAENMKPVTIRRKAKELLDNGKVAACVRALRDLRTAEHAVTVDTITAELDESRRLATADRQHSAAINATLGKAKLHGLLVDRQELTGKDGGPVELSSAKAALLRGVVPDPPA